MFAVVYVVVCGFFSFLFIILKRQTIIWTLRNIKPFQSLKNSMKIVDVEREVSFIHFIL